MGSWTLMMNNVFCLWIWIWIWTLSDWLSFIQFMFVIGILPIQDSFLFIHKILLTCHLSYYHTPLVPLVSLVYTRRIMSWIVDSWIRFQKVQTDRMYMVLWGLVNKIIYFSNRYYLHNTRSRVEVGYPVCNKTVIKQ